MCISTERRKVALVCQVGDLVPGRRYRSPSGQTLMVLDDPSGLDGTSEVVDLENGRTHSVANSTKLGYDRRGSLYASQGLNAPVPTAVVADLTTVEPAATCPDCGSGTCANVGACDGTGIDGAV